MNKTLWTALPIGLGALVGLAIPGLQPVNIGLVVLVVVTLTLLLRDT
jgi:hypothetical protein